MKNILKQISFRFELFFFFCTTSFCFVLNGFFYSKIPSRFALVKFVPNNPTVELLFVNVYREKSKFFPRVVVLYKCIASNAGVREETATSQGLASVCFDFFLLLKNVA